MGLGTIVALAGCADNNESEPEQESESEPESAEFKFVSYTPTSERVTSEEAQIEVTVANSGNEVGTQEIVLEFENEPILTESITLDPSEEADLETVVDSYELNHEEYSFNVKSEDDSIADSFLATVPPVEEPTNTPEYTIQNNNDISFEGAERRDVDVTSYTENRELVDLSREDIINICKDVISDIISNQHVNAVSFNFWRDTQSIGAEQAQLVVDWAPNGNWGEADSVNTGNYIQHDFSFSGLGYVIVTDLDYPESVELEEDYRVSATIENKGFVESSRSGAIERGDEVVDEFEIELEPDEETVHRATIPGYESRYYTNTVHTVTGRGTDQIWSGIFTIDRGWRD